MKTSEQTNEISAALAKAQGEIQNPSKDNQNPHFRSFYADLSSGLNAIRSGLAKNGISYVQATRLEGEVLMLDTRLSHSSGQWIEAEFPACRFPAKPQEVGSALTYARRYSLFALVGIAGEDDDGNAANASETPAQKKPVPPKPPSIASNLYDQDTSQVTRDALIEAIDMAINEGDLRAWSAANAGVIARLMEADRQAVRDAYSDKLQSLKNKEAE